MNEGKLVWRRHGAGGWTVSSMVDEKVWYTVFPDGDGGWVAEHQERVGPKRGYSVESVTLSAVPPHYLRDAKRLCDIDHHQAIRNRGDDELKSYIERWPL